MSWEAIGAIGEIVGALGVILTLVYLATQVKYNAEQVQQNTAEMRNAATQSFVAHKNEANFLLSNNGDLAKIVALGIQNFDQLAPYEQFQFKTYFFAFYNQFDFAYHQYKSGRLEEKFWMRMNLEIPATVRLPGAAAVWEQEKVRYTPEFVAFVEEAVENFEPPDNEDWSQMSNSMFVNAAATAGSNVPRSRGMNTDA